MACTRQWPDLSSWPMHRSLRLFALILALTLLGTAAALQQLWLQRRVRTVEARMETASPSQQRFLIRELEHAQERTLMLQVGLGMALLVFVALLPTRGRVEDRKREIRRDFTQTSRLAQTTAEQATRLQEEREARHRLEENLHLQQVLTNQVLEEKMRLGRDLHDDLVQSLYATGITLESSRAHRAADAAEADRLLDRGIELLNRSIREMRAYIGTLAERRPLGVRDFSAALGAVLDAYGAVRGVGFRVEVDPTAESRLRPEQLPDLLQIIREAVSNALRHGEARTITIRLQPQGDGFTLEIADDGRGFDPQDIVRGHGLDNLELRANLLGARLCLESRLTHGTCVRLSLGEA